MRCLMRSLISDGLMDIAGILEKYVLGAASPRPQGLDAPPQRSVNHEIPVAHDGAPDQRSIHLRMQTHRTAQSALEHRLQLLRLLASELARRNDLDVRDPLGLGAQHFELRGNL